jgi:hypothetical protein
MHLLLQVHELRSDVHTQLTPPCQLKQQQQQQQQLRSCHTAADVKAALWRIQQLLESQGYPNSSAGARQLLQALHSVDGIRAAEFDAGWCVDLIPRGSTGKVRATCTCSYTACDKDCRVLKLQR